MLYLLVLSMAAVLAAADENAEQTGARFLAIKSTTVQYDLSTVYEVITVPSICASLFNVTGACRRRRGIEEEPVVLAFDDDVEIDLYKPSAVQPVESTLQPQLRLDDPNVSGILPIVPQLQSSSQEPEEVEIRGLESDCIRPRIPGVKLFKKPGLNVLTFLHTSKATATITLTTTTTAGFKPFIISICTPVPFIYPLCP